MITLHTWKTPNGRKPAIMLEEVGLPYEIRPVDISKDEQFAPDFLAIAPNNKIPALVDGDGPGRVTLFESGAILTYLAEKTGQLLPASGQARWDTLAWLHWQIGGLGPMLGQLGFFAVRSKEKAPLAIDRFTTEAERLIGVMEKRLAEHEYLGGPDYSIADIATYPWIAAAQTMMKDVLAPTFARSPATTAWCTRLATRPAITRGMSILGS